MSSISHSFSEMKFAFSHLRSKYFTAKLFHMTKPYFTRRKANFVEKSTSDEVLFSCLKRDKRCLNKGKNEQKVSVFAPCICSTNTNLAEE